MSREIPQGQRVKEEECKPSHWKGMSPVWRVLIFKCKIYKVSFLIFLPIHPQCANTALLEGAGIVAWMHCTKHRVLLSSLTMLSPLQSERSSTVWLFVYRKLE